MGTSNHFLFNTGNSGLRLNNDIYGYIDIADGPIRGSNAAIAEQGNGGFLRPKHVIGGIISWPNIAQVWKDTASVNGTSNNQYANFAVNSIRQIQSFPPLIPAPAFGGLVIGQVAANTSGAPAANPTLLAVGSGVYFGEWAPKVNSDPVGTNLNMASNDRTVWYVGDNAVSNMPTAINATYGVIGISQTGTNANGNTLPGGLPDNLNLYKGKLDVSYVSGSGTIGAGSTNNSISRVVGGVTHTISFASTTIDNTGFFSNGSTIEGRFYNGAEALAGMYTNGTLPDAAFGGSKVSGTITP
ncbi:hypothetical protein C666_10280 [Thauera linaloolentis 47Lol = DSM 12138]|uniref:Transferrin-binding protein B C-lobe/N-lobe beta barrel domain-containing protein n=1 Tax=Thauera linaloolentis (strain DSM 12138 / JCM 21573 / CCUG 41526 / CIP 105981 / IAM 15112 / NBRC 102519 / 47Lol) TaxID=1123367 RepID=N6Z691_THAL4|nr:hypothetical protein C666_10280 [Thauera linaloolentis 47Lol = DSM 12138]